MVPPKDAVGEPTESGETQLLVPRAKKASRVASSASVRTKRSELDHAPGTDLVLHVIGITYPDLAAGHRIAADRIMKTLKTLHDEQPLPARALIGSASGGGKTVARVGSIAWHFQRLEDRGILIKRNSRHYFVGQMPPSTNE
jgi:hypothetical protein